HPADRLTFPDAREDRVAACFHTGGTPGMPKVVRPRYSGMIYNGWVAQDLLFTERDVLICPLPLFHVFAAYPVLMACVASGAHFVMPTPAGYRGEGVFDNFWKLVERWGVSFFVTVPTAVSALMQRKVDADISSLKTAICGSAPLSREVFNRFQKATGVAILEGYGLTEATCLVSCNPFEGEKKIGSVGLPLPYTDVRIMRRDADGALRGACATDEVGEICVANPGVIPGGTYTEAARNADLFTEGRFLRTGDLGRVDEDGYLWITGRAKDLIIRGGHNIDPGPIEDALTAHPGVAVAGAVGQPDAHAGEVPCVYVELVAGSDVTGDELRDFAAERVTERASAPRFVGIVDELPKTAVGKVLKNELRRWAIGRVYGDALSEAGVKARVREVVDDRRLGLLAVLERGDPSVTDEQVTAVLGAFTRPWAWADDRAR
ncbi:MAG: AMP-binding protein, partial [Rhodobacteraceae bacterium]|nr:AMP-binding protein [Paracoccaceae bacterium]